VIHDENKGVGNQRKGLDKRVSELPSVFLNPHQLLKETEGTEQFL
jgi:hypothetical protein